MPSTRTFELENLIEIVDKYLETNRIKHDEFFVDNMNKTASLSLPIKGISTDMECRDFCIDISDSAHAKITLFNGTLDIIEEMEFSDTEMFNRSIARLLPIKSQISYRSVNDVGLKIDYIEKKINTILQILTKTKS